MDFMSNLDLPVSNEVVVAIIGSAITIVTAFLAKLFGLIELSLTKKEREADASMDTAKALEILATQIIKSGERSDKLFERVISMGERSDAEREMYRQRDQERDQQHATTTKALEKSLIESQEELKDFRERVNNLSEMVQKLSVEVETRDRTIAELNRMFEEQKVMVAEHSRTVDNLNGRILQLEADNKKAHSELAARDLEIKSLKERIAELEAKQQPTAIEATVTIETSDSATAERQAIGELVASINATKEPATPAPEPGKDGQPNVVQEPPGTSVGTVVEGSAGVED